MQVKIVMRQTQLRDGKWISARHYRWGRCDAQSLEGLLRRARDHGMPDDEIVSVVGPNGARKKTLGDWLKPKGVN